MLFANHEMTFVCFDIEKVKFQMLNIIGYFFSISYMPIHDMLKKKNMQRKIKSKMNKMLYIWLQAYILGDVRVIECTSKVKSPHQTVMIVCELKWFSHILNRHNMYTLMQSCNVFHTQHAIFFATLDTCVGTMWFGHHKVYMC